MKDDFDHSGRQAAGKSAWRRARCVVAAGVVLFAAACATIDPPRAPIAGDIAPSAAPRTTGGAPANSERHRLIEAFGGEYSSPAVEHYLDGVLARLAPAGEGVAEPYRVTLLDSPVVNAFALPSGDIFVTRGLLALANDTSEVAAVMAHEIGHITARHAAQRAELEKTAALFTRVNNQVLDRAANVPDVEARMKLSIARFSRQQEFEADQIGIKVIAAAGYDPYAASRFLTSLGEWSQLRASLSGSSSPDRPDMMATHPSTPERVAEAIAQARQLSAPGVGETGRDAYLAAIDGLAFGDNPAQGVVHGVKFVHPKLGFAFSAPEGFALENQSAALIGVGEAGGEALRLDSVAIGDSTSVASAIATDWIEGIKTGPVEALHFGDLDAATAVAQGEQWSFRLGAVRFGGRLYRLIYAAHSLTPAVDARFLASIQSFHRITPEDAATAADLKVRIVAAAPGDTSESLAARMADGQKPLDEFLVLNELAKGAGPVAGQRYKIVSP
jgi:predicted Zn-dependent protease